MLRHALMMPGYFLRIASRFCCRVLRHHFADAATPCRFFAISCLRHFFHAITLLLIIFRRHASRHAAIACRYELYDTPLPLFADAAAITPFHDAAGFD